MGDSWKNNISQSGHVINFYGNDFTVVIRPVLQDIFTQDMFYRNALVGFARYQKMQLK